MKKIEISLILPVYNSSKTIIKTLNSLQKQTFKYFELLIIDDFSTDNTLFIIKNFLKKNKFYKIKLIKKKKNLGVSNSRNLGLKIAKGNFIAFCDDDDFFSKNKLKKQLNFMKRNNIKFSFTDAVEFFDSHRNKKYKIIPKNRYYLNDILIIHNFVFSSIMFKNDHKIKFNENFKVAEDFLFIFSLIKKYKIICKVPSKNKIFYYKRFRNNSLSSNKFSQFYYWYKAQNEFISKNIFFILLKIPFLFFIILRKKFFRYFNYIIY